MAKNQILLRVVADSLKRNGVREQDHLVVAVSGGVDSMTLLALISQTHSKLIAVHINHGLRRTAARDEKAVADFSRKLGIPMIAKSISLGKSKSGIEERARILRYRELRKVAKTVQARYILTAHTADDQVETVLFNFLRGSSVKGLGGMKELSEDILRPLLNVPKQAILTYAKKHRIPHHNDETNASKEFTRNRIRHELLPVLRSYNPKISEQILVTAGSMRSADKALEKVASLLIVQLAQIEKDRIVLSGSKWRELDDFMKAEVLKASLKRLGGDLQGLTQSHFDEAIRFASNLTGKASRKRIGGKLLLAKGYDKITVSQKADTT